MSIYKFALGASSTPFMSITAAFVCLSQIDSVVFACVYLKVSCVVCVNFFFAELYENLGQVGASIKHHLVEGMRNMWQQLNEFARSHSSSYVAEKEQQDVTGMCM